MTDFPSTPNINDEFTSGDTTYFYNGTKWIVKNKKMFGTILSTTDYAVDASKSLTVLDIDNTTQGENFYDIEFNNIPAGYSEFSLQTNFTESSEFTISNMSETSEIFQYYYGLIRVIHVDPVNGNNRYTGYRPYSGGASAYAGSFSLNPFNITGTSSNSGSSILNDRDVYVTNSGTVILFAGADGSIRKSLNDYTTNSNYFYRNNVTISQSLNTGIGSNLCAISANPDGSSIYYMNGSTGQITHLSLSLGNFNWDAQSITTATTTGLPVPENLIQRFAFNSDGSKMVVTQDNKLNIYSLSTPWFPASGLTLDETITYTDPARSYINAMTIDVNDDIHLIVSPYAEDDTVIQSTYAPSSGNFEYINYTKKTYSLKWPSNVIWENNTAPEIRPGTQSVIYDFYSPDGGATIYGSKRYDNSN